MPGALTLLVRVTLHKCTKDFWVITLSTSHEPTGVAFPETKWCCNIFYGRYSKCTRCENPKVWDTLEDKRLFWWGSALLILFYKNLVLYRVSVLHLLSPSLWDPLLLRTTANGSPLRSGPVFCFPSLIDLITPLDHLASPHAETPNQQNRHGPEAHEDRLSAVSSPEDQM